jgi:hypothetical protein
MLQICPNFAGNAEERATLPARLDQPVDLRKRDIRSWRGSVRCGSSRFSVLQTHCVLQLSPPNRCELITRGGDCRMSYRRAVMIRQQQACKAPARPYRSSGSCRNRDVYRQPCR